PTSVPKTWPAPPVSRAPPITTAVMAVSSVDMLCLNAVYPLVEGQILDFCEGKDAVMIVEEGQPNFIEQAIGHMLYKAGARVTLQGKGMLPMGGEYNGQVLVDALGLFLDDPPPLNGSTLKYGFDHEGGPQWQTSDTSPTRSSRSFGRLRFCAAKAWRWRMPFARSAFPN